MLPWWDTTGGERGEEPRRPLDVEPCRSDGTVGALPVKRRASYLFPILPNVENSISSSQYQIVRSRLISREIHELTALPTGLQLESAQSASSIFGWCNANLGPLASRCHV